MRIQTTMAFAIAVTLISTSAALATGGSRCQNLPDIVTEDNAPVSHIGIATSGVGSGFAGGGQQLGLCSKPDHPWHSTMQANGLCTASGNLATLAQPVTTNEYKYFTYDGEVPDTLVHQTGQLNKKKTAVATAVASAIATAHAPENEGKPIWKWTPHVVVVEIVDWNAPTEGSHCS